MDSVTEPSLSGGTIFLSTGSILLFLLYKFYIHFTKSDTSNVRYHRVSPPSPWGLPIIGHLPFLGPRPFLKLTEWSKTYGNIFQIYLGPRRAVVINGAKTVRNILIHKGTDVAGRPDFPSFRLVNNGEGMIFNSPSQSWQVKRCIMQRAINSYMSDSRDKLNILLVQHAEQMVAELTAGGKSKILDPSHILWRHSSTLFHQILIANPNVSLAKREKEINELVDLFESMMKYSSVTMVTDLFPCLHVFYLKQIRDFRRVNTLISDTIRNQQDASISSFIPGETRDIADGLLAAHNATSPLDLAKAELDGPCGHLKTLRLMVDLVGAGQSTVASSLRWILLHMVVFPDIQHRVHAELVACLGPVEDKNNNNAFSTPHLGGQEDDRLLPYTSAVIWESRRHSCMFPFLVPHATTCDTVLDGFHVPKDTVLMFNIWSACRDTEIWGPDAESFNPTRFLDPETGLVNKEMRQNVLSFGAGRRRCIGEQVGSNAVFVLFVEMMRRCRFSLPPGVPKPGLLGNFGFDLETPPYQVVVEKLFD